MSTAGYSQTPLAKKLGIKEGFRMQLINQPPHYFALFTDMPDGVVKDSYGQKKNLIHFFANSKADVNEVLPGLRKEIVPDGIIWVSWPKKSAKVATDLDENYIREVGLGNGLVDVKVCAIDEIWSGLKFVIPVKDRKTL